MVINGSRVKLKRAASGKKVAEVAAAIDMSATWLYSLEGHGGNIEVKEPIAHALAKTLKVKVSDLIGDLA